MNTQLDITSSALLGAARKRASSAARTRAIKCGGVTCLVMLSATALANDQDLWAKTVPASICEPVNESQANEVRLSNGALIFRGNHTGTITFYCPISLNMYTLSGNSWDNDISSYRVYYRDTDGISDAARVTARLIYRRSEGGLFTAGSIFSSNGYSDTGHTTKVMANPHDVRGMAHYAFLVTLHRTNTSQSPVFTGIDFPFPAVP